MIRLEYPVGRVLYQTPGWVSHARVSPDGKHIAFLDHPFRGDDAGGVAIVDMEGRVRHLVGDFASSRGLAWTPKGDEIWFSAAKVGADRFVHAVRLDGSTRQVFSAPARDVLDIAKSGTLLIAQGDERLRMEYRNRAGTCCAISRSWTGLDPGHEPRRPHGALRRDGRGRRIGPVGLHAGRGRIARHPARRGTAVQLSPDGRWALAFLVDHPGGSPTTGVGEPRPLTTRRADGAVGLASGQEVLVMTANEPGKGSGSTAWTWNRTAGPVSRIAS
jgi:hypothetical protein